MVVGVIFPTVGEAMVLTVTTTIKGVEPGARRNHGIIKTSTHVIRATTVVEEAIFVIKDLRINTNSSISSSSILTNDSRGVLLTNRVQIPHVVGISSHRRSTRCIHLSVRIHLPHIGQDHLRHSRRLGLSPNVLPQVCLVLPWINGIASVTRRTTHPSVDSNTPSSAILNIGNINIRNIHRSIINIRNIINIRSLHMHHMQVGILNR